METLLRFSLKEISEGGCFVISDQLLPVGSAIQLCLIHPLSGEHYEISGLVVRSVDALDPQQKGIGIRFRGGSISQDTWHSFLSRHAPLPLGCDLLSKELKRRDRTSLLGAEDTLTDEHPPQTLYEE